MIDRVDSLTVLYHELGLGLSDLAPPAGGLMSADLHPDVRREPSAAEINVRFLGHGKWASDDSAKTE